MRIAAYIRYSSSNQREASLDDQLRNIRNWCERNGHNEEPKVYADAAISGTREDRPQYRQLVADATSGRLDLILVDDLSRLSRDSTETGKLIKRLRFVNVRLVGVSDGVDTLRKGHKIEVGLRGLMNELYIDELAEKTHRGLTGRALAGASAGGLPYGYRVTGTGERAIDPQQADVVRLIYQRIIEGYSPRQIAAQLNEAGVPTARGRSWCMSAIAADHKRQIGILANPIYIGRMIWNRSKWVKTPDGNSRRRINRPESEWIITERPDLAILDQATWDQAQDVLKSRKMKGRKPVGRRPKHLLSGLLRCDQCGGPLVIVDRYRYGCGRAKDRGASVCSSTVKVPRDAIENAILKSIREELLTPAAFKAFERETRKILEQAQPDTSAIQKAITAARTERDNIMTAIKAGIVTTTTQSALLSAEAEIEKREAELEEIQAWQPTQILPRAKEVWKRCVQQLSDVRDIPEARNAIRELVGEEITVREDTPGTVIAESQSEITLVAGARSGQYLTQPIRVMVPLHKRRAL